MSEVVYIYVLSGQSNAKNSGIDEAIYARLSALGNNFELVVSARGSTGLQEIDGKEDFSQNSEGESYDDLVAAVNARIAYVISQGFTPVVVDLSWVHGEADAREAFDGMAAEDYEANLKDFFDRLETDLAAPDLQTSIVRLNDDAWSGGWSVDIVRDAQVSYTNDPLNNSTLVDIDDVPMGPDNLHYEVAERKTISDRIFDTFDTSGIVNDDSYVNFHSQVQNVNSTITGTFEDDSISLGHDGYTVDALSGDDLIRSGAGNDIIVTNHGNDRIYSGSGDDRLFSGDAGVKHIDDDTFDRDIFISGYGNDRIFDFSGNDKIYSGPGDDFIQSRSGRDVIWGGSGDDTIEIWNDSISGWDKVYAGHGNDQIDISDQAIVYGGAGDNVYNVYDDEQHRFFGGDGVDTFVFTAGAVDGGNHDIGWNTTINNFEVNDKIKIDAAANFDDLVIAEAYPGTIIITLGDASTWRIYVRSDHALTEDDFIF